MTLPIGNKSEGKYTIVTLEIASISDRDLCIDLCLKEGWKKIALTGAIGVGKSTFIRSFCERLGVDADQVTSPTYTRYNTYESDAGTILHCDMRRAETEEQLIASGTLDAFYDAEYIFVERPKRTERYIDNEWTQVDISYEAGYSRIVTIRSSAST